MLWRTNTRVIENAVTGERYVEGHLEVGEIRDRGIGDGFHLPDVEVGAG